MLEHACPQCGFEGEHCAVTDAPSTIDANAIEDRCDEQDLLAVAGELAVAADLLARVFASVRADEWERTAYRSDVVTFTIDTFTRYMVHDPVHHVWVVRQGYAALGD